MILSLYYIFSSLNKNSNRKRIGSIKEMVSLGFMKQGCKKTNKCESLNFYILLKICQNLLTFLIHVNFTLSSYE